MDDELVETIVNIVDEQMAAAIQQVLGHIREESLDMCKFIDRLTIRVEKDMLGGRVIIGDERTKYCKVFPIRM